MKPMLAGVLLLMMMTGVHARPVCDVPIEPVVADVDGRFGFTRAQVERAVRDAEGMWQAHSRGRLFGPAPGRSPVPVNLVYGSRQQRAEQARSIRAQMDVRARVLDERRAAHRRVEARVGAERAAYRRAADSLGPRSMPSDRRRVETLRVTLNASIAELNESVAILNREAREYNALVARYNRAASTTPEQAGRFSYSSQTGGRIDVFRAVDHEELVWIIAHELGHALGLGHVEAPRAVMAAAIGPDRPRRLAAADVAGLRQACGIMDR